MQDFTQAMLGASKDNDVVGVSSMLNANASPDCANTINQSALHIASMWGSLDVVRLLIAAGADPNNVNRFGATPLHCAAQRGQSEVGRYLIVNGADPSIVAGNRLRAFEMCPDPDLRKDFGAPRTVLHDAARGDDPVALLTPLLAESAEGVNSFDEEGVSPLAIVVARGHESGVQLLLEAKADPSLQAKDGLSPLHLVAKMPLLAPDADGAAETNAAVLRLARTLLDAGADPRQSTQLITEYTDGSWERKEGDGTTTTVTDRGTSCVHLAVEASAGQPDMVELLLDGDADVNARDGEIMSTPLHVALEEGFMTIVNLLIARRADVNVGNRDIGLDNTPLHDACKSRDAEVVRVLISAGADVNRAGKGGFCPLHLAGRSGKRPPRAMRPCTKVRVDLRSRPRACRCSVQVWST